jgi:hypothetical protein
LDKLKNLDNKTKFLLGLGVTTVLLYAWLTSAIIGGNRSSAVLVALIASPISFLALALTFEKTQAGRGESVIAVIKSVFSFKKQAWSFIIGDLLLLPVVAYWLADKWAIIDDRFRVQPPSWWLLSLLLGVVAGGAFHAMDKKGYAELGHAKSIDAPTKLFHDFVTYPVLFGGFLYAFVPMVINSGVSPQAVGVVLFVALWAVLGIVRDGGKAKELAPWGHPWFDWLRMEPVAA